MSARTFFRRSRLAKEIVLMLVIKLALIFSIKFFFFSNPVPKDELVPRLQGIFGSESSPSERVNHGQ